MTKNHTRQDMGFRVFAVCSSCPWHEFSVCTRRQPLEAVLKCYSADKIFFRKRYFTGNTPDQFFEAAIFCDPAEKMFTEP